MKRLLATAAIALALGTATAPTADAGGMVHPVTPPIVVVEDTASSAHGILVPVLALIFVVAALHH
ncbi:hypothetical protein roselon_02629 [Roseibacterium elongatum DSM 19469]|uniref:Ferrochelatase n=1 Tax=Roseicyclus elongatus DSM 19469 TaxID=1294273 RepID=W8RUP2_9RHOB|nr:hypothetical protein [Roseibacterium elongatum]AHM04943.1 hypothetical protein roselon_02629 [Roseibacterium elongatum DSM 19469]